MGKRQSRRIITAESALNVSVPRVSRFLRRGFQHGRPFDGLKLTRTRESTTRIPHYIFINHRDHYNIGACDSGKNNEPRNCAI